MTALAVETFLLLAAFFFLGAAIACGLRRLFAPAQDDTNVGEFAPAAAVSRPVEPLPEIVAQRGKAVSERAARFEQALTAETARPAPQPAPPSAAIAASSAAATAMQGVPAVEAAPLRPAKVTDAIRDQHIPPPAERSDISALRSVKSEAFQSKPTDAATTAAAVAAAARSSKVVCSSDIDDLKRIRGIGVLIEKRLNAAGVTSYEQVASWTDYDVAWFSYLLGFEGRIERENWVEQARILASGGSTEFSRRIDADRPTLLYALASQAPLPLPRLPDLSKHDALNFSVVAPTRISWGERFLLHLYLHASAPQSSDEVLSLVREVDSKIDKKIVAGIATVVARPLDQLLEEGDRVEFFLEADGLIQDEVVGNENSIVWTGKTKGIELTLKAPLLSMRRSFFPIVRMFVNGALVGRVKLSIERQFKKVIVPHAASSIAMVPYRKAFLSYSSDDRAKVLERALVLAAAKVDVFQDVVSLRLGQDWKKRIVEELEACDIFFLFWSEAASKSKWVRKEARIALRRQQRSANRLPEIIPVPIGDGPLPPRPRWLQHLQFNDPIRHLATSSRSLQRDRA